MRVQKQIGLFFGLALAVLATRPAHAQVVLPEDNEDAAFAAQHTQSPPAAGRNVTFNGRALTPDQMKKLAFLEAYFGQRLPDGKYWYDNRSGAMGMWGGPAMVILPPNLGFGGPMPANASGGGTRMFVNGRELHPIDVARLGGPAVPGRFWLDANGNYGIEGGPMLGNLRAQAGPAKGPHCVYCGGGGINNGPGGIVVNAGGASTDTGSAGR
jgi:hypothetical protein